jgi:hypothetical protein
MVRGYFYAIVSDQLMEMVERQVPVTVTCRS